MRSLAKDFFTRSMTSPAVYARVVLLFGLVLHNACSPTVPETTGESTDGFADTCTGGADDTNPICSAALGSASKKNLGATRGVGVPDVPETGLGSENKLLDITDEEKVITISDQIGSSAQIAWVAPKIKNVEFQLYQSTTNDINSVTSMEAGGGDIKIIKPFSIDATPITAKDLETNQTYYYNVVAKDVLGHQIAYTMASLDMPIVAGQISVSNQTETSLTLQWTTAASSEKMENGFLYAAYMSTSNNIVTREQMEAGGEGITLIQAFSDKLTADITGLAVNQGYYFNILVKNRGNHTFAYNGFSVGTPDLTEPNVLGINTIVASNIGESTVDLAWSAASDSITPADALQYQVYRSTSNNIFTVAQMEAGGGDITAIKDYSPALTSYSPSGLAPSQTYYFNVIVKDLAGNKSAYSPVSATTIDLTGPYVGGAGIIATSSTSETSLTLQWNFASDNVSANDSLQYQVYRSSLNNISSVAQMEAGGNGINLIQDYLPASYNSLNVSGLTINTLYFFNIIVKDAVGNKSSYQTFAITTPDQTNPTVSTPVITTTSPGETSVTLNWTVASDNISLPSAIEYQVFRSSTNNIATVDQMLSGNPGITIIKPYTAAINSFNVTGLTVNQSYYFNVIAKDAAGNKIAYTMKNFTTPDQTGPVPGSSGVISQANLAETSVDISWSAATDNVSSQASLQYQLYKSTSNNINTVAQMESGDPGISAVSSVIPGMSVTATGLDINQTYYFNVVVRDSAGNKSAYTARTITTPDLTSPDLSNGALTSSNLTEISLTLDWIAATDNVSSASSLQYQVYRSLSNNITSVAQMETAHPDISIIKPYATNISTFAVTGLAINNSYYFNIIVKDASGNKRAYTPLSIVTPDLTAPVVDSPLLSVSNLLESSVRLNWESALDNATATSSLQYTVYKSAANNISTVALMEAGGAGISQIQAYTANVNSFNVSALTINQTYYFNVIVKDGSGNKTAYTTRSVTTPDLTAPTVGGSGEISTSNVVEDSATLSWFGSTDNLTAANNLQYQVYQSTADNIGNVAQMEAGGAGITLIQAYSSALTSLNVTGLSPNQSYFYNLIVKDAAGNKSAYNTTSLTTLDLTSPVPGNTGTISVADLTEATLTLNWTQGSDNVTDASNLQYQVYRSSANNISSVSQMETGGAGITMIANYTSALSTLNVTGLSSSQTYYFNIIIKDGAGNKSAYTTVTSTTPDLTNPTVGASGALTISALAQNSLTLSWSAGSDNVTIPSALSYQVYQSTSNNISSIAQMESGDPSISIIQTYGAGILNVDVTGLSVSQTYYYNVIVKDAAGNKSAYTVVSATTPDETAPTVSSGVITLSNIASTSLTMDWTKATDNVTAAASLQYQVYKSTSNNISTVSQMESGAGGISIIQPYTADIGTFNVTGLTENQVVYLNIIVKDAAGNKTAYTSKISNTGGGTITVSNLAQNSLTLTWDSPLPELQYQVYQSTANNISTVAEMEAGGAGITMIQAYTANLSTLNVTSLTVNQTYYFNIIVKNTDNSKAPLTSVSATTLDQTNPTVGGGGTISTASPGETSVTLNWTAASDNVTTQANLQYQIYRSTSNNISSVALMEAGGAGISVIRTYIANINTFAVTALTVNQTYYFNLIVKDAAGNKTAYNTVSFSTPDQSSPTVGGAGSITVASLGETTLTLNWTAASDNVTAQGSLQYQVYKSTANNITSIAQMEAGGAGISMIQAYSAGIVTLNVTGLTINQGYYFNLIVKDATGNKTAYTAVNATPIDLTSPTIGASGVITVASLAETTLTLNWTAGSDNITTAPSLLYQVYRSTSNNITSVAQMEAGGAGITMMQAYTAAITTYAVTGLTVNQTYYFNIIIKDAAGNKSAYVTKSATTVDLTVPGVGNSGIIAVSNLAEHTLTLTWTAGSDNVTAVGSLQYQLYRSTANNISSVALMEAGGAGISMINAYTAALTTFGDTGLTVATTYYYNLIIKDSAGNKSAYTTISATTPDQTAPVVGGSGVIAVSNLGQTSLTLTWNAGTDNVTAQGSLQYQIYQSSANNISSIALMEAGGAGISVIRTYTAGIVTFAVTGLSVNQTYYFNMIVKDATGNKSAYTTISASTPDQTAPTAGGSGVITVSSLAQSSLTLTWASATDNVTSGGSLQYQVYQSSSNNITSVAQMEAGTPGVSIVRTYAAGIASTDITGLTVNQTYYYNLIVKDAAGNKTAYVTVSATTPDQTAPTMGGSGAMAASSITETGLTLTWTAASDNLTSQANLQYQVYQSTANNITSIATMEAGGAGISVIRTYIAGITTFAVTGLSAGQTYYFNLIVRDAASNKKEYVTVSATTPDLTNPVVGGSGVLTTSAVTQSTLTLAWTAASDNVTTAANLQYLVYYSLSNNITSVADAENNGTAFGGYTANITNQALTGLLPTKSYYFNVIVKDQAGLKAIYTSKNESTVSAIHAIYYDATSSTKLKYISNGTGSFVTETVYTGTVSTETDLFRESNGKLHVSFYDGSNLRYAIRNAGTWTNNTAAVKSSAGSYNSIVVDASGVVHIFYKASGLDYISGNLNAWGSSSTLSTDGGSDVDVVKNGTGNFHIMHRYNFSNNRLLKYITGVAGSWSSESTIVSGKSSRAMGITVESGGTVHAAFYNSSDNQLRYATGSPGSWTTTTLDSSGDTGEYTGAVLDSANKLHVCYYDTQNTNLKYATNKSGSWVTSTVDGSGINAGSHCSIAMGSTRNQVHIVYYDSSSADLKYAYGDGVGTSPSWTISTLDSTNSVGQFTSIVAE